MRQHGVCSWEKPSKRMSWQMADVHKGCTSDSTFWTSTDVLQDAQVALEVDSTRRIAEQELSKKWWTRVMQFKLRHLKKVWKSQMQVGKRGKLVSQISIQAGRRAYRQAHPRGENLSKDPVRMSVHWRVVLRRSTTFCVTRQLSTSAEIALH